MPQIISFASPFSYPRKHRIPTVMERNIIDQLHNDDGLPDACPSEQPDLSSFRVGFEEINDLDPCLQHLGLGFLVLQGWGRSMDGISFFGIHRTKTINGIPQHVHHTPQCLLTDRNRDRSPAIRDLHTPH